MSVTFHLSTSSHVLTSLQLTPAQISSVGCFGLGFILDIKRLSQRRRAQLGLYTVVLLNLGVYIWSIVMQVRFNAHNPGAIDWDDSLYPSAFLPYFFVQTTGPLSQSYMYWLISSFATDAQCGYFRPPFGITWTGADTNCELQPTFATELHSGM